jgi:histidinol phosphatase-like enzyme
MHRLNLEPNDSDALRRYVFLDRDGTITVDRGYLHDLACC